MTDGTGSERPARFADDAHRYALEARIATGGMGEVWRARDTVLGRAVAVKLLKAEYADDATFRRRFETEAQHAAALAHPGIASVYDFGEAAPVDGSGTPLPYLVMELVDGQPLSALLRPGSPMDTEVTRDLMAQAADALSAAHRAGIVHRDVKPANLIITADRRVKVTDFGIARAAEGMALTETGQVMGTPQYLSPEQAEGGSATPASDVYSLGVVAYECLTGTRPFTGDSPVTTALAHVRQPVPDLPAAVPADLAAVVRRALAKQPAERFADGGALAAAFRAPEAAAPTAVVPPAAATQAMPAATPRPPAPAPAPAPAPTPSAPTPAAGTTAGAGAQRRSSPGWSMLPWLLLLIVLLVGGVWLASVLTDGDDEPTTPAQNGQTRSRSPSKTPSQTTPTETTPAETTPTETSSEPEPTTVEIDPGDYVGRDHQEVEQELRDLDLKVSSEKLDNPGDQTEGVVESVSPTGTLQEGDEITVTWYDEVQGAESAERPLVRPGREGRARRHLRQDGPLLDQREAGRQQ